MSAGFTLALCAICVLPSAFAASLPLGPLGAIPRAHFQNRQSIRSTTDPSAVFVPEYAQRESWGILAKYQQSDVLLQGANVSPSGINNNQNGLVGPDVTSGLPAPTSEQIVPLQAISSASDSILSYHAMIDIGTPAQHLGLVIDTGVADSWVAASCNDCETEQFDASASNTYRSFPGDFRQAYGNGYVWGTWSRDNVTASGLTASPQSFGSVTAMDVGNVAYSVSGVLGFAFASISSTKKTPFFESLISEASLPFPLFSVALGRGGDTDDSELCLGCINNSKYNGNITWIPLVSHTYWTIMLSGLQVGGLNTMTTGLLAAIDTASNQIHVPMSVAKRFYATIPGSKPALSYGEGFWTFPCNSSPDIQFIFMGPTFSLDPRDFNLGKTSSSSADCVGAVLGMKGRDLPDNFAVIGSAFLRSWYTVFDYSSGSRIGFGSRSTA
ncbi:acid protease [Calocera cornea HHB12733]|uniref:Acid protease n=1 Tax=Calocera cornea HHB12733 TaxID=1353952 RepID=A0A165G991_9BASI|nr:acid protease [Calocera cornea HHB12733]